MKPLSEDALEIVVGRLLKQRGMTLAVAESCTGGLVSHRITDVPGSSAYYQGSVTAYSNEIKERVLRVQHATLEQHGAVSAQTAREMARGVRDLFRTDVGLAVTGIAGPGGGMPGKPVGLVYIALSTRDFEHCEQYVWPHNRAGNKATSANAALTLLLEYLKERAG